MYQQNSIFQLTLLELKDFLQQANCKAFHAKQIFRSIYHKGKLNFHSIPGLPDSVRLLLWKNFDYRLPKILALYCSVDGSKKILLELADGEVVETVLMKHDNHYTVCVSSQVGCAMNCRFCLTATLGLKRNLTVAEIVSQVFLAKKLLTETSTHDIRNIVFMGMGEPLQNYHNVVQAIRIFLSQDGFSLCAKRITVSTVGLLPRLKKIVQEPDIKVNIALSLNATNQRDRSWLMPVGQRYPLADLVAFIKEHFRKGLRERIMLEYILIQGVSDSIEQAKELVQLVGSLYCKVNLIVYNENTQLSYRKPNRETIYRFQKYLLDHGVLATQRHSKGQDIMAACGQLAMKKPALINHPA